jgi:hypothetical protein
MKHHIWLAIAAVALGAAWGAPRPPVHDAVLTGVRGTVEVGRGAAGTFQAISYTTFLTAGDRVRAGRESGAALIYADGRCEALGAEATATIRPGGSRQRAFVLLEKQLGSVLAADAAPLDLRGFQLRGFQLRGFQLRGTGEVPPVIALTPRYCAVLDDRPAFGWQAAAGTTDLKMTVSDLDEKEIWSDSLGRLAGTRSYPDSAPALKPGEYIWELTGRYKGHPEISSARFVVLAVEGAAKARADMEAARQLGGGEPAELALVAACMEHRLFPQAEAGLAAARKRSPEDRTLALLLAKIYSETRRDVPEGLVR